MKILVDPLFFPFFFLFFDFISSLRYPSHNSSSSVSPQISNNHRVPYSCPFENPFNCIRALSISIELLPMLIRDTDISTGIWIHRGHRLSLLSDGFIVHGPTPHYSSLHQRYSNGIKKADLESTVRTFFFFFFSFFFYSRTNGCDGRRLARARIPAPPDGLFRIVSRMNPVPYLFSLDSLPTFCTHHPLHSRSIPPSATSITLFLQSTHAAETPTRARDRVCSRVCALNTCTLSCV